MTRPELFDAKGAQIATSDRDYPASVYKPADAASESTLIVGWHGKDPIHNECKTVADASAKAAALKDGFGEAPVLPKAKK